jgi:hypothetical protein
VAGKVSGQTAGRFPGFDSLDQSRHWDQVTAEVVAARIGPFPAEMKFFTAAEQACAGALLNLLTGQDGREGGLAVPSARDDRRPAGRRRDRRLAV